MDELLWRYFWKPLAALAQPLGTLTIEFLLSKDLTQQLQSVSSATEVTIRPAVEADLVWITTLYADEPYLYLGNYEPGSVVYHGLRSGSGISAAAYASGLAAYRERLRRGEKCFLAFVGSEIAHVNWLCFSSGEEAVPGHSINLLPCEAYTTDAFTVEKYRGKNIHATVLREMLRTAQTFGCRRAYTVTQISRHGSFGAFRQLGWQVHGRLLCFVPRNAGKPRLMRLTGSIGPLLRDRAQHGTDAPIKTK